MWGSRTGTFHSLADLLASWRVQLGAVFSHSPIPVCDAGHGRPCSWRSGSGGGCGTRPPALIAALFMALAFLHVRDSHYGTTDIDDDLSAAVRRCRCCSMPTCTNGRAILSSAGLLGGLAAATKYNALLLAVPMVASYLLNIIEEPGRRSARHPRRTIAVLRHSVPGRLCRRRAVPGVRFRQVPRAHETAGRVDGGRRVGARA